MEIVKDFHLSRNTSIKKLVKQMYESGGFQSKNLALGIEILKKMINDKNCLKFLSFTANIVSTGTRGIIKDFIKKKFFDVVITTAGTLDHDIARSYENYFHGNFFVDDRILRRKGIHRLGNIFIPEKFYGLNIEKNMIKFLNEIYGENKRELASYEFCWEIGKRIRNKDSILHWSWKNKIPIIVPGITDGAVGYQIWQFSQDHNFKINTLRDETLLSDLVWDSKKTGALILGGGISKHHTIWWNQFKGGLDYAVYISTASEFDGSLSGAKPREAISWNKIKENAEHVFVEADVTLILPIIYLSLI